MSGNSNDDPIVSYLLTLDKDVDPPEDFTVNYLNMRDGTKLRHLSYQPETYSIQVILLPGMNTLLMSWYRFLILLKEHPVKIDYIETREKITAVYSDQTINFPTHEDFLLDAEDSIDQIRDPSVPIVVVGSSMGSNTLIHSSARKKLNVDYVIVVGPLIDFKVPSFIKLFLPIVTDTVFKYVFRPITLYVVIRNKVDKKKDPFQAHKYFVGYNLVLGSRFKRVLKAWMNTTLREDLKRIDGNRPKFIVIGAESDKLHDSDDAKSIADSIPGSSYVNLKTNFAAHDKPLVNLILNLQNTKELPI